MGASLVLAVTDVAPLTMTADHLPSITEDMQIILPPPGVSAYSQRLPKLPTSAPPNYPAPAVAIPAIPAAPFWTADIYFQ